MPYGIEQLVGALERLTAEIEKCHQREQKFLAADWIIRAEPLIQELRKTITEKTSPRLRDRTKQAIDRILKLHPDAGFLRDAKQNLP